MSESECLTVTTPIPPECVATVIVNVQIGMPDPDYTGTP